MKTLFEKTLIYENLLLVYFSKDSRSKIVFNGKLKNVIERFLEIYLNEDAQKGTTHLKLIKKIYSNPRYSDRDTLFKELQISDSTLRRYRLRYSSTLKLLLERLEEKQNQQ